MEIIVLSENQIQTFQTDKRHIVFSVRSPGTEPLVLPDCEGRIGVMFLIFNDLDENLLKIPELKIFDEDDAKSILLFAEGMKPLIEMIVCQCEAGISRSAGIAGALSKIYNGTDEFFFKNYLPNRKVYRTILQEYYKCRK